MQVTIAVGVFMEKQFHPRPGEKFHAHRVYLASLVGGPDIIQNIEIAAVINLKSMPGFVRQNVDVTARAVKIGKYEGRAVIIEISAKPAAAFSRFRLQVEKLAVKHKIKKLGGLRAQLVIHLSGGQDKVPGRALGFGVARFKMQA